jgi:hypothetical protein
MVLTKSFRESVIAGLIDQDLQVGRQRLCNFMDNAILHQREGDPVRTKLRCSDSGAKENDERARSSCRLGQIRPSAWGYAVYNDSAHFLVSG